MTESPQLVAVHLFDELPDAVGPVAFDMGGGAQGRGHHLVPDHKDAKVEPFEELLDDDARIDVAGGLKCRPQLILTGDVDGDPSPMVPDKGLHRHRKAEFLRLSDGLLRRVDDGPFRDGDAPTAQERLGQEFVVGDLDTESRGAPRHGRLDALLLRPPTELNQGRLVEAYERDITRYRLLHDRGGRRPEHALLSDLAERLE